MDSYKLNRDNGWSEPIDRLDSTFTCCCGIISKELQVEVGSQTADTWTDCFCLQRHLPEITKNTTGKTPLKLDNNFNMN